MTFAVVICNWNKKDDVETCIKAVLASTVIPDMVYVVDNASTDGSQDIIKNYVSDKLMLIENRENLGGSGGFNTGITAALKKNYDYIHLLDNDATVEPDCFEKTLKLFSEEQDIVAIGSKVLIAQEQTPTIQEMGALIDWKTCHFKRNFPFHKEDNDVPRIVECDYVPACSVMIKTKVIRDVGIMNEDNFIYWDDIEWFYRMKKLGKRVVAYRDATVLHKLGGRSRSNTFGTYYFARNRLNFFLKNCAEDKLSKCIETLFCELFQAIFFSNYKGQLNTAKSLEFAIQDALNNVRGRAGNGRIIEREPVVDRFQEWITGKKYLCLIVDNVSIEVISELVEFIKSIEPSIVLALATESRRSDLKQFNLPICMANPKDGLSNEEVDEIKDNDAVYICKICGHISNAVNQFESSIDCYVDGFRNSIITKSDREKLLCYDKELSKAKTKYMEKIVDKVKFLRSSQ